MNLKLTFQRPLFYISHFQRTELANSVKGQTFARDPGSLQVLNSVLLCTTEQSKHFLYPRKHSLL